MIRGAASLQYGTQFGGLVNFILRPPPAHRKARLESRQTFGSYGLWSSFQRFAGTSGRWSYSAHYQHKQGNGFRPNSRFRSHQGYVQLGYAFSEQSAVRAEVTLLHYLARQPGGLTDAQFTADPFQSNRGRNWFAVDWRLASLRWDHRFADQTRMSVQCFGLHASREAVGFRTNRVSQIDDPNAARDLLRGGFRNGGMEARFLHRYRMGRRSGILLVGSKLYLARNTAIQGPASADSTADFRLRTDLFPDYPFQSDFIFPNRNLAVFSENIFRLSPTFSLTPGVRFEILDTQSEGAFRRINFDLAGNPILNEEFRDDRRLFRTRLLLGLGTELSGW